MYDGCNYASEGIAEVSMDGKVGFVNAANEVVIPLEYEAAYLSASEGLVIVKKDGKWGAVDTNNTVIRPFDRTLAYGKFVNGLSAVFDGSRFGFVDTSGNLIIPHQFDDIYLRCFEDGIACVEANGKWGVIDTNGSFIIPCIYANITYNNGYFALLKDGEASVVSRDELQPTWRGDLAAHEQKLIEQAEVRAIAREKAKLLKEYTDKATVKSVQVALNDAGFPCGTPDGAAGKKTKAALSDYQAANGLTVTGTITHETLVSMGLAD